ncbi:HAMP domain-containing protein [candidate division WOR-3 bacterium]|uniref:histidine kinase n=1 Tax=candidate division WOR-3 bacterium TaxID=2052148 RepID=A0A938BNU3_UNCW3|nr:HAMP domain-containing protein [candidate division WOR-3 bacterium]
MKRYILLRLLALQLAIVIVLLVAGLAARGTRHNTILWVTAAVVTVATGAVSYLVARSTVRPLRDLTAAFRRLSAGDFDVRVLPAKRGRLRELGDDFNQMVFRTKTLVDELRQQREALDAIVASIQEGLAVVDGQGRIVLANASFRRLAGESKIEGRYYWEIIREPDFVELVRSVTAGAPLATRQIEIADRIYACSANYLATAQQVVLTLHDDTEVARAAQMKKDFVQNVSHELRTPLTAIKGFAETMEATIDNGSRPYLETIIRNTDRLVSLVQDLLTLSELEERGAGLQLEDVDLRAIAAQMLPLFDKAAKDKGLELKLSLSGDGVPLRADRFKLEQVFINLLDNAVKYTDKGEVELAISREDGKIVIEVRDTGPGIAAEHLPRLFERFYVVDKGRSRRLGGTGLGLSIVKHIVLLHSGDISVRSTPGAGTAFTISLPIGTT